MFDTYGLIQKKHINNAVIGNDIVDPDNIACGIASR